MLIKTPVRGTKERGAGRPRTRPGCAAAPSGSRDRNRGWLRGRWPGSVVLVPPLGMVSSFSVFFFFSSRPHFTGGDDSGSSIKKGQCKPRPPPPPPLPPRPPLFSSRVFSSAPLYSASPGVNDDASLLAETGEKRGRDFPTALGMSRKRGGGRERNARRAECVPAYLLFGSHVTQPRLLLLVLFRMPEGATLLNAPARFSP